MIIQAYTDQEAVALVSTASKMTGTPIPVILEDFGEFIVPTLFKIYHSLIKPEWKTLDLIENAEETIHRTVRIKNPSAEPPKLKSSRPSADEVIITYTSPRKMCGVAKGIAKGIANYYNEQIQITETKCMLKGSSSCQISIKLVK
ncbi:MAG: heme NO-binding domain-containing protein [Candidatus Nanoarchaeia archaeon]|jgi:hypothetical protein